MTDGAMLMKESSIPHTQAATIRRTKMKTVHTIAGLSNGERNWAMRSSGLNV